MVTRFIALFATGLAVAALARTCDRGRQFARAARRHDLRVRHRLPDDCDAHLPPWRWANRHDLRLSRLLVVRIGVGGGAWEPRLQRRPLAGRRGLRDYDAADERRGRSGRGVEPDGHRHPLRVPADPRVSTAASPATGAESAPVATPASARAAARPVRVRAPSNPQAWAAGAPLLPPTSDYRTGQFTTTGAFAIVTSPDR